MRQFGNKPLSQWSTPSLRAGGTFLSIKESNGQTVSLLRYQIVIIQGCAKWQSVLGWLHHDRKGDNVKHMRQRPPANRVVLLCRKRHTRIVPPIRNHTDQTRKTKGKIMTIATGWEHYSVAIKKLDDSLQVTKFKDITLDQAEEIAEGVWMGTGPRDDWAGVAVIDSKGEIYSELEW